MEDYNTISKFYEVNQSQLNNPHITYICDKGKDKTKYDKALAQALDTIRAKAACVKVSTFNRGRGGGLLNSWLPSDPPMTLMNGLQRERKNSVESCSYFVVEEYAIRAGVY